MKLVPLYVQYYSVPSPYSCAFLVLGVVPLCALFWEIRQPS